MVGWYGKQIDWNDFKRITNKSPYYDGQIQTNVKCPICDSNIFWDSRVVLTTYPAQYSYYCKNCGWAGNSYKKRRKE